MPTLNIWNYFEIAAQGRTIGGKHGSATDGTDDPFAVSVDGLVHDVIGSLATAAVVTVYDDDNDVPVDWVYCYIWADQPLYVQLIAATLNATFKIAAKQPFVLPGFDSLLAAVNTTLIAGGTEPTLEDIDSVVLGNYSGSVANYHVAFIQ